MKWEIGAIAICLLLEQAVKELPVNSRYWDAVIWLLVALVVGIATYGLVT